MEFMVAYNGKGFDLMSVSRRPALERGMGLFAMEERARIPGGAFQIETQEGQGTRVWLCLPLSEKGEL
jgi:signal transduction histidine kinase